MNRPDATVASVAVAQALREYGTALRRDWSAIDGRAERDSLHAIADLLERGEAVEMNHLRRALGICPHGGSHWDEGRCDGCGTPSPTAETEAVRDV